MTKLTLKRLLNHRKPTYKIISELLAAFESPLTILDVDGSLLAGEAYIGETEKNAVEYEGNLTGWVLGELPQASIIAHLLEQMLAKEAEKRALAGDLLDKYRELNLLYNLSEHLLSTPDPRVISATTLQETGRLIKFTAGWLLLLEDESNQLNLVATAGDSFALDDCLGQ